MKRARELESHLSVQEKRGGTFDLGDYRVHRPKNWSEREKRRRKVVALSEVKLRSRPLGVRSGSGPGFKQGRKSMKSFNQGKLKAWKWTAARVKKRAESTDSSFSHAKGISGRHTRRIQRKRS